MTRLASSLGLHTGGAYSKRLKEVLPHVDWVGFDIKTNPEQYDELARALEKVGAKVDLTSDQERVGAADAVVLPGVGAFGDCMRKLRERGMDEACGEAFRSGKPFLGVCVALQVISDRPGREIGF